MHKYNQNNPNAKKEYDTNNFHKETAYFASGCFWGTQYHLEKVKGVDSTHVGYMGGTLDNPSYPEVKTGTTGPCGNSGSNL